MGGKHYVGLEKIRLADINKFFILEYVKRNLFLDENQRRIVDAWKNIGRKINEILEDGSYIDDADEITYSKLIDFFVNKQPITEKTFSDCFFMSTATLSDENNKRTIEKLNSEINSFEYPEINQLEALKYYDLFYLIQHINIPARIKLWDRTYSRILDPPPIYDENGYKVILKNETFGYKSGILGISIDRKGKETIHMDYDPFLCAPAPKDPRIHIVKSSEHEIGSSHKILNHKNVEGLYINRFDSVRTRLVTLFIWDKVHKFRISQETDIAKFSIDDAISLIIEADEAEKNRIVVDPKTMGFVVDPTTNSVVDASEVKGLVFDPENELKNSSTLSPELLKKRYQDTRKDIENVFKDLSKIFTDTLTFST